MTLSWPDIRPPIVLVGLPGSGKSKVAASLQRQFGYQILTLETWHNDDTLEGVVFEWNPEEAPPEVKPGQQVWCVLDARRMIEADSEFSAWLKTVLCRADGLVWSFAEQSELSCQTAWEAWLTQQYQAMDREKVSSVRWFHQQFPAGFAGFPTSSLVKTDHDWQAAIDSWKALGRFDRYRFECGRVRTEHLMMALDNSTRVLGMKISRVEGVLDSFEHHAPVAVEGTPYHLTTHLQLAETETGWLEINGFDLDRAWFEDIVNASQY